MKNYLFFIFLATIFSCRPPSPKQSSLFEIVRMEDSGISFNNEIIESDSFNILNNEFMYNGGGVGIGDFNQDGLQDIYFTGNAVPNQLYLNQGNFQFREVGLKAGVAAAETWSSGVAILDINNDELPDIYVSATFKETPEHRTNRLFINKGNNAAGIPVFKEEAAAYGLADTSHTTQTYFFDYDKDGDLDAFLLNDKLFRPRSTTDLNLLMKGGESTVDKLLRNNGAGKFEDVSVSAGITFPGFGLGAALVDVNADGWLDIYVSNDFISNDLLYVNQQDGTFKNELKAYFKHNSFSSMGIDATDLNGDGLEDIMTLDMLPEDQSRVKRTYSFQKYKFYDLMESTGYSLQYNRNMLQLSDAGGRFRDVSEMAGVDATEWSWSVIFADLDNDARKDIAITNGYPRDITDLDFTNFSTGINKLVASTSKLLDQIPVVKVRNYFYRNLGEYTFSDQSEAWGIHQKSFSNGAVVVDLDNDGDLDYVVNNINDPAHIYENKGDTLNKNHFLRIQLQGDMSDLSAAGARVHVSFEGRRESVLNLTQRGYLSSIEPFLHFGLGETRVVDSVLVEWTDGTVSIHKNIPAGQVLKIAKKDSAGKQSVVETGNEPYFFKKTTLPGLDFNHSEIKFFDFNFQVLLPRLHSREGPGLAVGDINGDQAEDLVIGNGSRQKTHLYTSTPEGTYKKQLLKNIPLMEDTGLLIFDADNDGDNDLYVASGSTEFRKGSSYYQDQLYLNDGQGSFKDATDHLPEIPVSTASVSAVDFDRDGDLDLLITGRIEPQNYPMAASSYLLRNNDGYFESVAASVAPELNQIGMVSQGLWTDYNQDGWTDLILVGEWMPVSVFENQRGQLRLNRTLVPTPTSGWWNSVTGADLDNDGDMDYVLGNQGLNNKINPTSEKPLLIFAQDFDENGSIDPVIAGWQNDAYYPLHLKMDLTSQLNFLKKKYLKYEDYSTANIKDMFTDEILKKATRYEAHTFESAIMWNKGSHFELAALPREAQFAPVYGSWCKDVDLDGDMDILLVGNRYNTEVFEGRHDAFNGLLLINGEDGNFSVSGGGFNVDGDARSLVELFDQEGRSYIIAGVNDQPLAIHQFLSGDQNWLIQPEEQEYSAIIHYKTGAKQLKEFYIGSSFLAQSSPRFMINPELVNQIEFYNLEGGRRQLLISDQYE